MINIKIQNHLEIMNLLNKHLLFTFTSDNKVYKFLRRINRETKSQYISDAQRTKDWRKDTNEWFNFQTVAKRFIKNKLVLKNNKLSDYYGNCVLLENNMQLISDIDFNEMFKIIPGNNEHDLFKYEHNSYNSILKLFKSEKTKPFLCCLDTEYIGQYLKQLFNVPVYVVDRMYNNETREHFHYARHDSVYDKYQRNAIFYQVTSSGNDKKIITSEENKNNSSIVLWFFDKHIVYCKDEGKSEW